MKTRSIIVALAFLLLSGLTSPVKAGDHATCQIDQFVGDWQLQTDSSLDVTEKITVSCEIYDELHGIFRVLPTIKPIPEGSRVYAKTPITLQSIADEAGQPFNYTTQKDAKTLTYKIGDADRLITEPTTYIIKYRVANVVTNLTEDQFNWDIWGDSWQWPVENYQATVKFPEGITDKSTVISIMAGSFGSTTNDLVASRWLSDQELEITNVTPIPAYQAITIFHTFPSGIISPYQPSQLEKNIMTVVLLISALIPLATFIFAYRAWLLYGKDVRVKRSIAPEFAPPQSMRPLELVSLGFPTALGTSAAATLIDLAVRGFLVIEERPEKGLFGKKQFDFEVKTPLSGTLQDFEEKFLGFLKEGRELDQKSDLLEAMKAVGLQWSTITSPVTKRFVKNGIFDTKGTTSMYILIVMAIVYGAGLFFSIAQASIPLLLGFAVAMAICIVFAALMSKRTQKGAELYHQTKGFVLYLKTAERYRQVFNEKENIFERFLPYAIVFGLTKQWSDAMKKLYGDSFTKQVPLWYVGSGSFNSVDFVSSINSITQSVASTASSSAGGGSGGGGGGGGGGGW